MDITANEFYKAMACIRQQIGNREAAFDYVVGISRGGLIPAVFLSHRLEVPLRVVEWSTRYTGQQFCPEDLYESITEGKRILLVDDILDSGRTIRELLDIWGSENEINVSVACIIHNTAQNLVTPDFWFRQIDRNVDKEWVNFWWEKNGHI
jgi:hypoxanthine phosphoribosyltransferase